VSKELSRASASAAIDAAMRSLCRAITWLEDAHLFAQSDQLSEALFEMVQLRREILELPRQTGVPAPLKESPDPVEEDVPF
jgi:hypothetical protein